MKYYGIGAVLLGLTITAVQADTWTVDDDGKADFNNIQAAVNAASDGDEILVMPGTYTGSDPKVVDMNGKAVWLHSSDGPEVTFIQGNQDCRGIICISGETSQTVIEGLTITGGHTASGGGGMYIGYEQDCHPTIKNCIFINNSAWHEGAGVRIENSNPTFENCTFTDNTVTVNGFGGGMFIKNSNPTLTGCVFNSNSSVEGGGIYVINTGGGGSLALDACVFVNNSSTHSGGGIKSISGESTLTNCTFEENAGGAQGGGGIHFNQANSTLTDCTFTGNHASGSGAIAFYDGSTTIITNCAFNSNTANANEDDHGGAIYTHNSEASFFNCTFMDNLADLGGAIITYAKPIYIDSCFFGDNTANMGGALFLNANNAYVSNTQFCNNIPDDWYGYSNNEFIDEGGNTFSSESCWLDCNENGIDDLEDIANQTSFDCDQNGVPDECQPDCDGDGWIDACDNDTDIDGDGIPDNCELDCNENSLPDDFEIAQGLAQDCNGNGIPDECDLVNGGQVPEGAVQWTTDEGGNGHWYLAVEFDESTTESSMIAFANGLGASLASISSLGEDAFVRSVASNVTSNTALLGGYETSEGEFIWLDGTDFDYTNWDAGQPDGVNSGEYVAYYEISNFDKWHDVSFTDSTVTHFIIEFSETLTDCNSNGTLDSCEIADDPSLDCNGNGLLDTCDITDSVNYEEAATKLISDDALPSDWFGHSVDVDGDLAIIGAPFDGGDPQGTAYIFRFNGNEWIQEAKLLADDGGVSDRFGFSVAISGSKAIVGAYGNDAVAERSGAAYIYAYNGSSWIQEAKLVPSNGDYIDYFGKSVSIYGDLAIVGATDHDGDCNCEWERGAAYIFRFNTGVWTEEIELSANDGESFDYFGFSVSIHGTTGVVGAVADHNENGSDAGSVYVYDYDGITWNESKIISSDGSSGDRFGHAVDIHESTIMVGAWASDEQDGVDAGSAYIFRWNQETGGWDEEAELTASDGSSNDFFGWSVSVNGNTAVAGVPEYEGGGIASGAAYKYTFDGTQWSDEEVLIADNRSTGDKFGFAVSVSDSVTLAGAYGNDDVGNDAGSAHILHLVNDGTSSIDCDGNGVIDSCEMADNPSLDCNGNGTLDSCEDFDDCNYNEIPDSCDITDGTSNDVNMNGVPDECESDCNENGIPDDWEIKKGLVFDCNENMLPDECDIADGTSTDVNDNTIPDECEDDCNGNGIPDDWDIKTGAALDCNGNGIPDYCDVAAGCDTDCNLNGVPDSCDLASGTSEDINANNLPDECECIADITDDGTVDIHDILALIGYWESAGPLGDLNADGVVSIHDLLILVAGWGECMNIDCGPPEGAVQWRVEDGGNGHWYGVVRATNGEVCFDTIRSIALNLGGDLAIIQSGAENSFITDLLPTPGINNDYWIGLIQNLSSPDYFEPSGGWEWTDGTPLGDSYWHSSEPNDPSNTENACGIYSAGWFDMGYCRDLDTPQYAVIEWSD